MGQKSRWTLPETVHPDGYRRFVICVPDERFYIAAFQGLLIELTYSKNWQRDSAQTAAVVSRVWEEVLKRTCEQECTTVIEEMGYDMSVCEQLRFEDGKLQGLCCGVWSDITGQEGLAVGGSGQPGSDSQQAVPGECVTYHGNPPANFQWYLPTVVNAGDTLEFKNKKGAATDAPSHVWYCPNGQLFFAGACVSVPFLQGGDPAVTADHMTIVCQIDGVWYGTESIITVPGGVSNAPVLVQVNDGDLSDNAGGYAFDVEYCNNSAGTFSHEFNFALNDGGFVIEANGGDPGGVHTLGSGWQPTIETGPSHWYELYISRTFPSRVITGMTAYYNSVWTANTEPGGFAMYVTAPGSAVSGSKAPDQGTPVIWPIVGSLAGTLLRVDLNVGKTVSGHLTGEDLTLYKLIVAGIGSDPF